MWVCLSSFHHIPFWTLWLHFLKTLPVGAFVRACPWSHLFFTLFFTFFWASSYLQAAKILNQTFSYVHTELIWNPKRWIHLLKCGQRYLRGLFQLYLFYYFLYFSTTSSVLLNCLYINPHVVRFCEFLPHPTAGEVRAWPCRALLPAGLNRNSLPESNITINLSRILIKNHPLFPFYNYNFSLCSLCFPSICNSQELLCPE